MKIFQINNLEKQITKFYDINMNEINNKKIIDQFQKVALGFPKAILYSPPLRNKIYAVVKDSADRTQYFYTKTYQEKTENNKFKNILELLKLVKSIIEESRKNIDKVKDVKMREIYSAILLIYNCNFRVGNDKYKELYGTDGTTTLKKNNMKLTNKGIEIKFIGKKQEPNYCLLKKDDEEKLYNFLLNIYKKEKNEEIFKNINYIDIYEFLKEKGLRPKDIRMVSANEIFFNELKHKQLKTYTDMELKKHLKIILNKTSQKMNHTPTVCKNKYLMPQWFDLKIYKKVYKSPCLEDFIKYNLKI